MLEELENSIKFTRLILITNITLSSDNIMLRGISKNDYGNVRMPCPVAYSFNEMSVSALVISLSQRAKQHTDEIIVGYYSRHLLFTPEVLEMMRHLES